jgi:hypothetical protein
MRHPFCIELHEQIQIYEAVVRDRKIPETVGCLCGQYLSPSCDQRSGEYR